MIKFALVLGLLRGIFVSFFKSVKCSEAGAALIAVFWILLLLSILAMGYAGSARLRAVVATNEKDTLASRYLQDSALTRGRFEYDKFVANRRLLSSRAEIEGLTGKPLDLWWPRYSPYFIDEGGVSLAVQVRYEDGRLDVNALPGTLWDRILLTCGVEDADFRAQVRDSILDWIDGDDLRHAQGVEMSHYLEQTPEYYCKNNKIQVLEELMLVRGVSAEIYYGTDRHPGLVDFLSVYGAAEKFDVNSASPASFLLLEGATEDEISAIEEKRGLEFIEDLNVLADELSSGTYSQLLHYFTVVSSPSYITIAVSSWPTNSKSFDWLGTTYRLP